MMTDPIADMLTRIRNAGMARYGQTRCPASQLKLAVARVLEQAGFLSGVQVEERDGHHELVLNLRYDDSGRCLLGGIRRISKPGRRVYVGSDEIPKVRNGLGVAVISTSKGVLSDTAARAAAVGGELICEVW